MAPRSLGSQRITSSAPLPAPAPPRRVRALAAAAGLLERGLGPQALGLLAALRPLLAAPTGVGASRAADAARAHAPLLLAAAAASAALRSCAPLAGGGALLVGLLLAADVAGAPANVLADATIMSNCTSEGDYGAVRKWASIGWGLAALPAGWLVQHAGLSAAFVPYAACSLPLLAVGASLRYSYSPPAPQPQPQPPPGRALAAARAAAPAARRGAAEPSAPGLRGLLAEPRVAVFLWFAGLSGFAMGHMATCNFIWLKELGAPETLMGLALLANVATEVPAFAAGGAALRAAAPLGGPPALLAAALAVTAARLAAYGALPAAGPGGLAWALLPIELTHGITFGLFWSTATVHASSLAPPHLSASMQSLWQAAYGGVGAGLGGLAGGVIMQRAGGQAAFLSAAAFVAAGTLAGVLAEHATAARGADDTARHKGE
ncbi:MFSD6 [Scenedesmus sp. PABB004]|nr:MFSD6 [Scenedesmus sp. PABB004]